MHQFKKAFFLTPFLMIGLYFIIIFSSSILKIENPIINEFYNDASEFVSDEISPFCNGVEFSLYEATEPNNIKNIKIHIFNKEKWFENMFDVSFDNQRIIDPKFKKNFSGEVQVIFNNGVNCLFPSELRISGDYDDHINPEYLISSLDVSLEEGSILGITNFKLFLPETRNFDNEVVVSSLMKLSGFITPRTFFVNVDLDTVNNSSKNFRYIFQEKPSKEMIEYNGFREGPMFEVNESFRWDDMLNGVFRKNGSNPLMIAKLLNNNWANRTGANAEIAIQGLEMFNKAIFYSYNSEDQLNYNYIGEDQSIFYMFDAASLALLTEHAMTNHNRAFFFNKLENQFYPIYYDGDSNIVELGHVRGRPDYGMIDEIATAALNLYQNLDIDIEDFYLELIENNVSIEKSEAEYILNKYFGNLNTISGYKASNPIVYNSFQENNDFIIYKEGFHYYFYNSANKNLQKCDSFLDRCEIKVDVPINREILSKKIEIDGSYGYLLGQDVQTFLNDEIKYELKSLIIENSVKLNVYGTPPPVVNIDKELRNIDINFNNNSQRVVFEGPGTLNNWKIVANANAGVNSTEERQDHNLLTGCLSFYKIKLENLEIVTDKMFCEDSLNIINSNGVIDKIEISDSASDGLDLDFSEIKINRLNISSSGNDCADFSSGGYIVMKAELSDCLDKGVSLGEKSSLNIMEIIISNSKIGVAVKDSSVINIENADIKSAEMCFSAYRKKQEFGPSEINLGTYLCNASLANFIQRGSVLNARS